MFVLYLFENHMSIHCLLFLRGFGGKSFYILSTRIVTFKQEWFLPIKYSVFLDESKRFEDFRIIERFWQWAVRQCFTRTKVPRNFNKNEEKKDKKKKFIGEFILAIKCNKY